MREKGNMSAQSQPGCAASPASADAERSALEGKIADLIGQCVDIRVTYDSVQRRYTHVANADELAASIMRMVSRARSETQP